MVVLTFFGCPSLRKSTFEILQDKLNNLSNKPDLQKVEAESCYYVDVGEKETGLPADDQKKLLWVLSTPLEEGQLSRQSHFTDGTNHGQVEIEIGPRLNFSTPFSTNAVSICHSVGLVDVKRIEVSTRYLLTFDAAGGDNGKIISKEIEQVLVGALHDKMTQCRYLEPIESFSLDIEPEPVTEIDVMNQGKAALEKANKSLGLAFDDWDLDYYTDLFQNKIGRNPTSVECFDLAQSNSEHSRHWFFKGKMVIDGQENEESLFQMVMGTQAASNDNNVIKFNDNSSAIKGYPVQTIQPKLCAEPSAFHEKKLEKHIIFTAETHNFPTGVAPFPGATTGTGGRIRDVQATGRGAHVIAGTAGYSFGNLNIPGYKLPWEDDSFEYPSNFALPVNIAIEASNGASDYGNKFGEPVLTGFARSFGLSIPGAGRREWVKPIMFSAGIGSMENMHIKKDSPSKGMEVVKIGGPVYRIGVGGGAASSIQVQGDNEANLDFGAVQRGDAEMEQKLNRVIRACIEMNEKNPICSIHDQGAGGNGNVLKEICEPAGSIIRLKDFELGDPTLSIMEIWGAEYQESSAVLVKAEDKQVLANIGQREKCAVSFVGTITEDGKVCLKDDRKDPSDVEPPSSKKMKSEESHPYNLDLEHVLGSMPRKTFKLDHQAATPDKLKLPENLLVSTALDRVLRLPSVASKRYLTNKVDRSVTGLVAQQQCVGPLHTPLADVAVVALSHFGTVGGATAIGEQPIKGLVNAACGARMSVGEALTNLVFARISDIKDIKCSGNWMWAAKLEGEGALLYDACQAMCDVMRQLGIAVDGGKDSLSMAARVGKETVKAPGTLVVSAYAGCPDITATVTPDLKSPGQKGVLMYVELSPGHHRLGGSALAQCYGHIGDESPDLDDPQLFVKGFNVTQQLIKDGLLSSGHDVSDGGLITCILEMAFAGNCGLQIDLEKEGKDVIDILFAEELGLVLEVKSEHVKQVLEAYKKMDVPCNLIGHSHGLGSEAMIEINVNGNNVVNDKMVDLRDKWEETSFQLERLQTNPSCVKQEEKSLKNRKMPPYKMSFDPETLGQGGVTMEDKPKVAVIREEGSNGDREMSSAFFMAGFEVWDVNMQDLCTEKISLDQFKGIVFVGGFSYADVLGSAKGWAATLKFNNSVRKQFEEFYQREDTFSLGVCNGCQLMSLLGWIGETENGTPFEQNVHLTHNESGRFESRFATVKLGKSPSIMLKGMEDSVLGIWVAHGEGRMVFKSKDTLNRIEAENLVSLQYVDDNGEATKEYPFNPNGSPNGIAGICSKNGRHLAMMPHPERCILPWQWAWMPEDWKMPVSPWLTMFKNAYSWCSKK